MSDQYAYWLASMQGISSYVCRQLFSVCRTAEEIYGLSPSMLEKVPDLTQKNRARILDAKKTWDLDGAWQQFEASGMSLTSWEEPSYPPQFRELADAPYGIFYRGEPAAAGRVSGGSCGGQDVLGVRQRYGAGDREGTGQT